jgi:hypothetical protein
MNTQAYLLYVTYYRKSAPQDVKRINEFHFSHESCVKIINRLEFLGYTIQYSHIQFQTKHYSQVG